MKKIFVILACFCLAFLLAFGGNVLFSYSTSAAEDVTDIERPDSIDEALNSKSLKDVQGRRVTIRQPIMQVLRRGLPRTAPHVMDNTFTLTDDEGNSASVVFEESDYPNGKHTVVSPFKRYMLVRQARTLNARAMQDATDGTLKKHPGVDKIYGEIPVENNAVEKRIVIDPSYKSPMTTGLYLAPGEVATVKVTGLKDGQMIRLYTHHQETMAYVAEGSEQAYYDKYDAMILQESKNARPDYESLPIKTIERHNNCFEVLPAMGANFDLTADGTYSIGSPYGGPLYISTAFSSIEITRPVELIIEGAVETPHFVLGVTTIEDFEQNLRSAPGLIATLDVENGQLIGPADAMRNTDDIEKLAYFWHSVFTIMESFNGKSFSYNCTLSFDYHVPAGAAVALSADRAAMPAGCFPVCMNYSRITTEGNWGTFHELGHIQDDPYGSSTFGMHANGEGEVTNNTMIVMIYTMLCNMDHRIVSVEHGDVSTHPYLILDYELKYTRNRQFESETVSKRPAQDYDELDYFDKVSQYATIIHYFGPEKFADFLYTYKLNPQYCEKSWRADYVYRIALVDKMNIMPWLNQEYLAHITDEMFSTSQLRYLKSLDVFWPVAYRWANGINDTETARKYDVDYLHPTTFDFSGDNILCPTEFKVLGFTKANYGTVEVLEDGLHVIYTPPKDKMYECDEFAARVRIERTGVEVLLPVRFNFSYKDCYTQVWSGVQTNSIDQAIEYSATTLRTWDEISSRAGRPNFSDPTGIRSYSLSRFQFVAEQSGTYRFYVRGDDVARLIAEKDGQVVGQTTRVNNYGGFADSYSFDVELSQGERLQLSAHLLNTGGTGYIYAGVKMPESETIAEISSKNMLHYALSDEDIKSTEEFGWKPKFYVSVKDEDLKQPTEKDGWEVIENPIAENGSDPQNIVDGNNGTIFHSLWASGKATPLPHIYVIDTKKEQEFSYFEIVTRSNNNSFVKAMNLYTSLDNEEWTLVYSTESLEYKNLRASMSFDKTKARYFKLEILSTSGRYGSNDFSVIAEINAGLSTHIEQTVKPSTFANEVKGFEENGNGELMSSSKGSVFAFEFIGTGFELFANTGAGYGSAHILIDGHDYGLVSLDGEFSINRSVYGISNLQSRRHEVRIETTSDKPFHIGYINVNYSSPVDDFVPNPPKTPDTSTDAPAEEEQGGGMNWETKAIIISVASIIGVAFIAMIYLMAKKKIK